MIEHFPSLMNAMGVPDFHQDKVVANLLVSNILLTFSTAKLSECWSMVIQSKSATVNATEIKILVAQCVSD